MKRLRIFWRVVGPWRDIDGVWRWSWPRFGFRSYIGRPCVTRWFYEWWLDLGIVSIALAEEEKKP
jgi:hypothetical protein